MTTERSELLTAYYRDRRLAHDQLFRHRHKDATAPFHRLIVDRLHERTARPALIVGFRGSAKSTYVEEAALLKVGFREFNSGLILGASQPMAMQRLHTVRREAEKNPKLKALFGDLQGRPWTDDHLEFSNGVSIRALGKGQALRGAKDEIFRPDFVLADDVEDRESLRTAEGREKIQSWLMGEVLQAMDPEGRFVMLANILHEECLAIKLQNPESGFTCDIYPVEYLDDKGQRQATWPDRGLPGVQGRGLEAIDRKRRSLFSMGRAKEWENEYMCRAMAERERPFRQDMKRVEPRVRLWEAVYAMVDPARTISDQAATTGFAVWSWLGPRLHVWELSAKKLLPSDIIGEMLRLADTYHPVKLGFEQDGLNQWALQPIRHEAVKKGITLPLVACKAPVGKIDFIKALQIYFTAREVWFQGEFPESWSQFLTFPTGNIDAPNALAYALHPSMKPGIAIYEDWNNSNAYDDIPVDRSRSIWLALNATRSLVTGALCQFDGDHLRIVADFLREGDPADVTAALLREANLEAGKTCKLTCGPLHRDRYNNVGLVQAITRAGAECEGGTVPEAGRIELRHLLKRVSRHLPALLVSSRARWTLNGFAGGYCRLVLKGGQLAEVAEDNHYRTLLEGIESFAGKMRIEATDDSERNYATTAGGQRYVSALPRR